MTAWSRADDVLSHRTVDTVLLLPPGRDEPLRIRGSGIEVWQRLTAPAELDDLVGGLADAYGESRELIAGDVVPFLVELERLGAVRRNQ